MKPVFISYATSDRKEALAVCEAIERRGLTCWIACRDVQPGENYQEAIVRAIRGARAMVLVFSDRANNSDEIKKEMSLVSRFHIPMLALRIEDVEPGDAFAYELATRQWIDLFEDWDKSIDALVNRVATLQAADTASADEPPAEAPAPHHPSVRAVPPPAAPKHGFKAGSLVAVAAAVLALVAIGGTWVFLHGGRVKAEHSMDVRWTGFQVLSPDLPQTMPTAIRDEIISAFTDDGVVGVSTAAAPPPGDAPAYALGGTVRRDGDKIRVIARLTNERSGTTLWSNDFTFDAKDESKLPRRLAIHAGNLIRCGLFGASTYPKPLPDPTLTAYLQTCHNLGIIAAEPDKAVDAARKVVAAAPDFSWGWSSLGDALSWVASTRPPAEMKTMMAEAIAAEDKAIALDPSNSEALSDKSTMIPQGDLQGRKALLDQALKARPLACGCEHHIYGAFLEEIGRRGDAIAEYRRAIAVLPLNAGTQFAFGSALVNEGRPEEAKPHLDAAADLSTRSRADDQLTIFFAPETHDYAAAARVMRDPPFPNMPADAATALRTAFEALAANNPAAKAAALPGVVKLANAPGSELTGLAIDILGALGANGEALKAIEAGADQVLGMRSTLFDAALAGARADPAFPGVADRLGLTKYWKATHTTPDFCKASGAPAYCKTL